MYPKTIFNNKNNVFFRASNGEYFERKLIRWDEKRMRYRQIQKVTFFMARPLMLALSLIYPSISFHLWTNQM